MLGPIQFVAFGFDSLDGLRGGILEQLDEITSLASVRILDVLFVAKEANGDVVALESSDLGEEDGDDLLGAIIGQLMGFSFDGEATAATADGFDDASAIGVTPDDVRSIAANLAPGSAAALLLIEHQWAAGLRNAIVDAGGVMISQGFLSLEGLVMVGAELTATADAIDAIEMAAALEAEATLRSLEALATIEVAQEIEAAVVARTVLTLVEAGLIEQAAMEDALTTLLAAEIIEQANTNRSS